MVGQLLNKWLKDILSCDAMAMNLLLASLYSLINTYFHKFVYKSYLKL